MAETHVKTFTTADEAAAEAAGLSWLAEAEDTGSPVCWGAPPRPCSTSS